MERLRHAPHRYPLRRKFPLAGVRGRDLVSGPKHCTRCTNVVNASTPETLPPASSGRSVERALLPDCVYQPNQSPLPLLLLGVKGLQRAFEPRNHWLKSMFTTTLAGSNKGAVPNSKLQKHYRLAADLHDSADRKFSKT